jgi:hypothetical protein
MRCLLIFLFVTSIGQAAEEDILDYLKAHPLDSMVQQPNGSMRSTKYGDYNLELAVPLLEKTFPRPWTVSKVLVWYRDSKDDKTRALLLRLLAASRDARAALVLGEALDFESLDTRIAGCYGLLDYFFPEFVGGGSEQHMKAAHEWFQSNKKRLQNEAANNSETKMEADKGVRLPVSHSDLIGK